MVTVLKHLVLDSLLKNFKFFYIIQATITIIFYIMTRLKSGRLLSCRNKDYLERVRQELGLVSVIIADVYKKKHLSKKVVLKKRRKFFKLRKRKKYRTYLYFSKENEIF